MLVALSMMAIASCAKKSSMDTGHDINGVDVFKNEIDFKVYSGNGVLPEFVVSALAASNDGQLLVPYKDFLQQENYMKEFAAQIDELSELERKMVGQWYSWEKVVDNAPSGGFHSVNGTKMIFLPNRYLLIMYKYYMNCPLKFCIGRWKDDNGSIVIQTNYYFCQDPKDTTKVCIIKAGMPNVWSSLYSEHDSFDWTLGYSYKAFEDVRIPNTIIWANTKGFEKDERRVISYAYENTYHTYPIGEYTKLIDRILKKDFESVKAIMHDVDPMLVFNSINFEIFDTNE